MRILGSDFDGTFNHRGVDDKKRQAVARWRAAGNVFCLVSGRSVDELEQERSRLGFACDYYVARNGARIVDAQGGVVFSAPCEGSLARELLEQLPLWGCPYACVDIGRPLEFSSDPAKGQKDTRFLWKTKVAVDSFFQISTRWDDEAACEAAAAQVKRRWGDRLNPLQNGRWLDIVRWDVNKARGVEILTEHLGAKAEDVVVVGDAKNDRDMIRRFFSYAMESGEDSLKELAHGTTPDVTQLIETLLAKGKHNQ